MTEHYIVTEEYLQTLEYLRKLPEEDPAAYKQYEQVHIQVPIVKDTPIERIYEGAEYIHGLRYPKDCA